MVLSAWVVIWDVVPRCSSHLGSEQALGDLPHVWATRWETTHDERRKAVRYYVKEKHEGDQNCKHKSDNSHLGLLYIIGPPNWIRTSDTQLRRLVLYPSEL